MGCDIHCVAEKKNDAGRWEAIRLLTPEPFEWRSYGLFGWLAGVRNYSAVTPLADPKGIPDDASVIAREEAHGWAGDGHSHSWHELSALLAFDYDQTMEDRRYTKQTAANAWDGGATCAPGEGQKMTYREFLGPSYFDELDRLKAAGVERVVFWFDN